MRIERNEFIKIFTKKTILIIFLGFAILNAGIVINNIYQKSDLITYTPQAYKAIYNDMSGLSNQEASDYVNKLVETIQFDPTLGESIINGKLKYTDNVISEGSLYREVFDNIDSCINYDKYLKNIDDTAQTTSTMSIFSKPNSFSYKNIQKTPADFAKLKGTQLEFGPSKGIVNATDFLATDVIAVVLILIVIMSLLTREKELSQLSLSKTTYKGRIRLNVAKLGIVFLSCIFIEAILYGGNLVISYIGYGFGDLSRPIQSVAGFISCNMTISVMQYFILFLLSKLFIYFVIASLMYMVAVICKNAVQVYITLGAVFGISAVLFYTIAPTSWLSLLKYLNLVSFLNVSKMFQSYLNLNFFGSPVNYVQTFIIFCIGMLAIFIYLAIVIFSEQKEAGTSKFSINFSFIKTYKNTSVFLHECYKILISGKVLFIIIAFGLLILYTYKPVTETFISYDDVYYKVNMKQLEGPVTQDKLDFIKQEDARYQKIHDEINKVMADADNQQSKMMVIQRYQEQLQPESAFNKVKQHSQYIQKNNSDFVYDSGYKLLTGDYSARNQDSKLALIAVAMCICCLVGVYSVEYQNRASILLRCSKNGRGKTFASKLIISSVIVLTIFCVTYIPYFYNVLSAYGTSSLSSPACSLENLSRIPHSISILQYLIIISIIRFIGLILSMLVIFIFSVKLKSYLASMLSSTGVLILPLVFSLLGIKMFNYCLISPFLIGNVF